MLVNTLKALAVLVLALVGGLGSSYAPVPTFAVVAVVFALGLWLILGGGGRATPSVPQTRGDPARIKEDPRSKVIGRLVSVYLLCWWVIMIAPLSLYTPREVGEGTVESTVSGSLSNQVLVLTFGLVGMCFLPAAIKRVDRTFWWVMALWGLYLVWAYTSLFWSAYPALTLRNLVAFVLVSVGCFGLGAGFYGARPDGRNLFLKHVITAGILSAMVILVPLPFHLGEFNPLDPSERLAISGGMDTFASRPAMVAMLTLIATFMLGLRGWRTRDWFGILVLVLPVLLLKTRGPLLWTMLTVVIVYLLCRGRAKDRIFQAGLLLIAVLGACIFYFNGVLGTVVPYITRGDVELTMTLTGRVPLWDALLPIIQQHLFLGVGFAAFWNPNNLYLMERTVGFPVSSAHNGYLEQVLNVGVIGLVLLLAFWVSAMIVAVGKARRGDAFGWLAFLFLLFYLFLNITSSITQEYLEVPFMVVFAIVGLLAVKPARKSASRREIPGTERKRVYPVPRAVAPLSSVPESRR